VLTDLEEFLSRETVGIEDRQDFAARIEEIISNGSVQTGQAGVYVRLLARFASGRFYGALMQAVSLRRIVVQVQASNSPQNFQVGTPVQRTFLPPRLLCDYKPESRIAHGRRRSCGARCCLKPAKRWPDLGTFPCSLGSSLLKATASVLMS